MNFLVAKFNIFAFAGILTCFKLELQAHKK